MVWLVKLPLSLWNPPSLVPASLPRVCIPIFLWQAVKKSPEAGSRFEKNCFILLLPKELRYRLQNWEPRWHPQCWADQEDVAKLLFI